MKWIVTIALLTNIATALPFDRPEYVAKTPDHSARVKVDEKSGSTIPLNLVFKTSTDKAVTLADYFADELPTIITFNYSNCPKLCSVHLNALTHAIAGQSFAPGRQYRILTIGLDPTEPLEKMEKTRQGYLRMLPDAMTEDAKNGWVFLSAEPSAIDQITDAVGFRYFQDEKTKEYFHPAANIFVSSRGKVVRYVYGLDIEPSVMKSSILSAGTNEVTTSEGFMHRCYSFNPNTSKRSSKTVKALQYGAAGFLGITAAILAGVIISRRKKEELS